MNKSSTLNVVEAYPPYDRHCIPLAEKIQVASNEPRSLDASISPLSSPPQSMDPNNFAFPEDDISRQDVRSLYYM